jgi:hypothetical protein
MTTRSTATRTPRERLVARANATPLATLADTLLILDAKGKLDEAERLTRATIIDSICERCPAADAAFDAWADSDDEDPRTATLAMAAAAKAA